MKIMFIVYSYLEALTVTITQKQCYFDTIVLILKLKLEACLWCLWHGMLSSWDSLEVHTRARTSVYIIKQENKMLTLVMGNQIDIPHQVLIHSFRKIRRFYNEHAVKFLLSIAVLKSFQWSPVMKKIFFSVRPRSMWRFVALVGHAH